jgi:hypothetical protein
MTIALYLAAGYLLALSTWTFYLAAMSLIEHRATLHPIAKANAYVVIALGLALDLAWNLVSSVLLLDLPRELLFTTKLKRLKAGGGRRGAVAAWVCEHALNQFDPKGRHC